MVWLLPGMTFEEAVRHIAKVDEEVTYSVDVTPQEARDLLARLKKSRYRPIRDWSGGRTWPYRRRARDAQSARR